MNKIDYFELWKMNKKNTICTMYSNLADDLRAGYDPFGKSVLLAKSEIARYETDYVVKLEKIENMDAEKQQRYCKSDLKRRGIIAA